MRLREASLADLDALIAAEQASFGHEAWTPGMVREEFGRAGGVKWLVEGEGVAGEGAEHGGELAGFAFGWLVVGELHVLHIATLPSLRRLGIGRVLLRALLGTPGTEMAWLEVRADNPAALGLYAAEGFTDVGVRKRYYRDGGDAVVMKFTPVERV